MLGPADVWVVGYHSAEHYSFAEHWDGSTWTAVSVPSPSGLQLNALVGVAGAAADDVTAVGSYADPLEGRTQGFAIHWRGSVWTMVSETGAWAATLTGVTALRGQGVTWAVGIDVPGPSGPDQTLTQRYMVDCSTPPATASPTNTPLRPSPTTTRPPTTPTATPSRTATATATSSAASATPVPPTPTTSATATWTAVASHTVTPVPPTATSGAPPATPTPPVSPTATVCPLQFADVPPGSPFYTDIRCLACRGIVSGYADGTFRPGATLTRGQAGKLLANAAGYADPIPPARQTFRDVPPGSPFWLFVERAAAHGVLSGYADGTFRPGSPLTRGQAAKLVANAAGFTDAYRRGGRRSVTCRPATRSGSSSNAPRCAEWSAGTPTGRFGRRAR